MGEPLSIEYNDIVALEQVFLSFGDKATKVVNDVLHSSAIPIVENNIQMLLPSSGRKWKGKKAAASSTNPLRSDTGNLLEVIIRSKKEYNYLYFPDDGTNTDHHRGNQHFMQSGADNSMNRIVDLCTANLVENFNKGG